MIFSGGCFCGAVRFESKFSPSEKGYCHCAICRKTTGAPLLAFASFPIQGFSYIKGQPTIFKSSEKGQREFCNICGTQICFREAGEAETVDVSLGSLDDINSIEPDHHIYTSNKVSWLNVEDQLPNFENARET